MCFLAIFASKKTMNLWHEVLVWTLVLQCILHCGVINGQLPDFTYEEFATDGTRNVNGPSRWGDIKQTDGVSSKYPNCGAAVPRQSPIDLTPRTVAGTTSTMSNQPELGSIGGVITSGAPSGGFRSFRLTNDGLHMKLQPTTGTARARFEDPISGDMYNFNSATFHYTSNHAKADSRFDFEVSLLFDRATSAAGDGSSHISISILFRSSFLGGNDALASFWHLLPNAPNSTSTGPTTHHRGHSWSKQHRCV